MSAQYATHAAEQSPPEVTLTPPSDLTHHENRALIWRGSGLSTDANEEWEAFIKHNMKSFKEMTEQGQEPEDGFLLTYKPNIFKEIWLGFKLSGYKASYKARRCGIPVPWNAQKFSTKNFSRAKEAREPETVPKIEHTVKLLFKMFLR